MLHVQMNQITRLQKKNELREKYARNGFAYEKESCINKQNELNKHSEVAVVCIYYPQSTHHRTIICTIHRWILWI